MERLSQFKKLDTLHLEFYSDGAGESLTDGVLGAACRTLPTLKEFKLVLIWHELTDKGLTSAISKLHQLTTLKLQCNVAKTNFCDQNAFVTMLQNKKQLQSLSLNVSTSGSILDELRREMGLEIPPTITEESLLQAIDALPALSQLEVIDIIRSDSALLRLTQLKPNLDKLILFSGDFDKITDKGYRAIASLKNLTKLNLNGSKNPPSCDTLTLWADSLKKLRELSLKGSTIDNATLEYLGRNLPLHSLRLSGNCNNLTERGVSSLQHCTTLKDLDVTRSERITAQMLQALQKDLPDLHLHGRCGCGIRH